MNGFSRACPSGNIMTEAQMVAVKCSMCQGMGRIKCSREVLKTHLWLNKRRLWKKLLAIYRDWKAHDETLPCETCDGDGTVERWI